MNVLNTAQTFYTLGVATIPVHFRAKEPALGSWRPYQTQMPSPLAILSWFSQPSNIGVVTGWQGLVVLDFDDLDTYRSWLRWTAGPQHGKYSVASTVARTAYRVSTSRGVHVYLWSDTLERNRKLPGIDVKARNGYVLGEGSTHPSGSSYRALTPGMIIPRIAVLSDVLPASILMQSDQPAHVKPLPHVEPVSNDPWAYVDQTFQITANLVDAIHRQLRIVDILSNTEHTSADGRWLRCQCPLHDDDDPSFWIDTQRGLCGCFAGCTPKPLDVINLYARLHGLSNREAIFALRKVVA